MNQLPGLFRILSGLSICCSTVGKYKLLRWIVHTLEIFMWPQDYEYVATEGDPFMELNLDMGENVFDDAIAFQT